MYWDRILIIDTHNHNLARSITAWVRLLGCMLVAFKFIEKSFIYLNRAGEFGCFRLKRLYATCV